MTMKPTLQLKLSQHLTLTPQLQQSIRLLQLSTLELNAEVERLLQENPLLEKADEDETPAPPPEFSMEASTATVSTESSASDDRDERRWRLGFGLGR
jgi:RNA polymerase sigma-54 factor